MTCKDCLGNYLGYCKFDCLFADKCDNFQDRSLWVKLPSEDYTFTIRGDLARGIIIANCRTAEEKEQMIKERESNEK